MSIHTRNKHKKAKRYAYRGRNKVYFSDIFNVSIVSHSINFNPNFSNSVMFAPDDEELQKIAIIDNFDDFEEFKISIVN